jgi:phosphatidylglycerophosphate synthase
MTASLRAAVGAAPRAAWSRARAVVPNGITLVGHALTIAWLLGAPVWIGAIGLLCDAADGFCARRMKVASPFGATYDWTVDVTVCAVVLQRLGLLPLALLVVPLQVRAHLAGRHVSGRATASIVLVAMALFSEMGSSPGRRSGSAAPPASAAETGHVASDSGRSAR